MSDSHARLREQIQKILDDDQDGFQLSHYVLIVGLEQIDSAGQVKATAWVTAPPQQADYITDGLIYAAQALRWEAEVEED